VLRTARRSKSHLAAALGLALVKRGWRVLFTPTTDLVQKLQIARRDLGLEAAIGKLDKYHLLILDDLAYVAKGQAETSVLFELISARYERRSLLITANQPDRFLSSISVDVHFEDRPDVPILDFKGCGLKLSVPAVITKGVNLEA